MSLEEDIRMKLRPESMLRQLNKFRRREIGTDLDIVAGRTRFPVHRSVIVTTMSYFLERPGSVLKIKNISPRTMGTMINLAYGQKVDFKTRELIPMSKAARRLGCPALADLLTERIAVLLDREPAHALRFFFSSDEEEIQEHAYGIILASTEMFEEELNSLTCHKLRSFIEFNSDEGNTPTLVRVASGWVRYDEERRTRHINCFISAGM